MKKITLLLSAALLACATNLWASDVVVYQLNTASTETPIATTTDTYSSISSTDCNSAAKDSEVTSAKWKVTLGSNSTNSPRGLWLGSNQNNTSYQTLGNGNFAEAESIAKAIGIATDVTNVVALISETELPNISKVNFACNKYYNKIPKQIWILASEDRGTTWNVAATATDVKTDSTFTFDAPIASARYALVCYYPSAYFNVRVPVLTFYKTVSDAKTVSVAVAEGQEEMGSVAMSYKANSEDTWTEATEPVEIAGEGEEEFQFVATPADGYKFAGWTTTGDIELNSLTNATTEGGLATETSVVTANFERNATLQSLAISGTATKVTYITGDTFNPEGLVVTATYSDGANDVVTDLVDWTFDPSILDEATTIVSVSATFKETNSAPFAVNVTVLSAPKTITIDLSKDETTTATAETLEWKGTILTITSSRTSDKNSAANNYYPGTTGKKYTSTRFYKKNTLTFTPADGITLRTITYTATSETYATAMAKSTWTNATATAKTDAKPYIVTITPIDGKTAVSATIYDTTGGTSFVINYIGEAKPTAIDNAVVETPAIKTIENGQLVILRDGVKYNAMGVRLQ